MVIYHLVVGIFLA